MNKTHTIVGHICTLSLFLTCCIISSETNAQTHPAPQAVPYSQSFGLSWFNALPPGFVAWNSSSSPCSSISMAANSFGISDQTVDTAQVSKSNGDCYGYSGQSGALQNNDGQFYIQTGNNATQGTCQLVMAINATGFTSIVVGYEIMMVSPQVKSVGVVFQYRVGTSGAWSTISNSYVHNITDRVAGQVDNFLLSLPIAVNNQPVVQLRWATWRDINPSGNSSGIAIDNIVVNATPAGFTPLYFRTVSSGNWNNPAIWQSSFNNLVWSAATRYPREQDLTITLNAPHVVSTSGLSALILDNLVINPGATFWNANGTALVINDGAGALDLDVQGTFEDSSSTSVVWLNNARWSLGNAGTLVKTTNSGSKLWQLNYYNGVGNIPATSTWICRKPFGSASEPGLACTNSGLPNTQFCYGNLVIENYTTSWNSTPNCRFNGTSNVPLIKGNLVIGGNGSGNVIFINENMNAAPVTVNGNIIVKAGSVMQNTGTGYEVKGDIVNNGQITYIPSVSKLIFSGTNPQTISGIGNITAYYFQINKAGTDLTINQQVLIDGNIQLTSGKINTQAIYPFIINDNAISTGASNSSYVNGPVSKAGDDGFIFPVGKNGDYQPVEISAGPAKTPFWTETFSNGCISGCLANGYSGPNGAWTQTLVGTNGNTPNVWYVSGKECGNNSGSCQNSCTGDASLHIGSGVSTTLDSGATYSFGNLGPLIQAQTGKRIESPVINCTGKTGILLEFNYIEGGMGIVDNAVLMYYNGSSWVSFVDLSKTAIGPCGPSASVWTNFRVNLPASANNNPNVRIGFLWTNSADGNGANPSFAVDDITLTDQSDRFTAEYFHADPRVNIGNAVLAPLNHISQCEYWSVTRDAGTASKKIALAFDVNSCGVTNLSTLQVALYKASNWGTEGNSAVSGTTAAGTITSNFTSGFGNFTLSSLTNDNPLPVALLYFDAIYKNKKVDLSWSTASEFNNDYFTVQRSKNGIIFEDLLNVDGAGTSTKRNNYSVTDGYPYQGKSYYRLRQADYNATFSYSKTVGVNFSENDLELQSVSHLADESAIETIITIPEEGQARLIVADHLGKLIVEVPVRVSKGMNIIKMPAKGMTTGLYFMQLFYNDQRIVKKFLF